MDKHYGHLAAPIGRYPLDVLHSAAGYYIGTQDADRMPVSRESVEYFPTEEAAEQALATGAWTQRVNP